jgi:uncharacterized OB-fold protein
MSRGRCSGMGRRVFAAHVPYVLALIELEEGPVMMSNVVGSDRFDTRIGDFVIVEFEETGGVTLPRFRRQETAQGRPA